MLFRGMYVGFMLSGLLVFIGNASRTIPVVIAGYVMAALFGMGVAVYLPILCYYKYKQINTTILMASNKHSNPDDTNKKEANNKIMLKMLKRCTIVTFISLIGSWCNFIIMSIVGTHGNLKFEALSIMWVYVWIFDVHTNFLGAMLSNDLFGDYYMKLCGCVDNCVGECFAGSNMNAVEPAAELASYVETKTSEPQPEEIDDEAP